jgi:hypothetical protein
MCPMASKGSGAIDGMKAREMPPLRLLLGPLASRTDGAEEDGLPSLVLAAAVGFELALNLGPRERATSIRAAWVHAGSTSCR